MEKEELVPFWYYLYGEYDDSRTNVTDVVASGKYSSREECYKDWSRCFNKIGYPMIGYDIKEIDCPTVGY